MPLPARTVRTLILIIVSTALPVLASSEGTSNGWDYTNAPAAPGALECDHPKRHFLLGEDWRWQPQTFHEQGFLRVVGGTFLRFFADVLAIPANVVNWSAQDFALFTAIAGPTIGFMIGPVPLDSQVQFKVREIFGYRDSRFQVWTPIGDVMIWTFVWGLTVGALLKGWFGDQPELVEMVALMIEAFGLGQIFQLVPKLLLGREGPKNGEGLAVIYGPSRGFALFPAGTPSGHASTLYALMGVVSAYWQSPWLTAALQLFGLAFCSAMLVDDYHFVSDIWWGAAMGWALGEWVVRHRSSRYRYVEGTPVRVLPLVEPKTGAVGAMVGFSF